MPKRRDLAEAVALFAAFFALYAVTAQRGFGWGDSGEFQYRILHGISAGQLPEFATLHPLYLWIAKPFASSPYSITLISSFFGALCTALFRLCSRNNILSALFGLSHALWWLSCVSEVYTMSLAFIALETILFLRWRKTGSAALFALLAGVNGLHLELHNIALLALPVYGISWLANARKRPPMQSIAGAALAAAAWCAGASYWIWAVVSRGPADVLFGRYGGQVAGFLPGNVSIALFNWALAGMSFAIPALLLRRKMLRPSPILALFLVHFSFWSRYFIISQFTFALPSIFFAYLLVAESRLQPKMASALGALQTALPVAAYLVLSSVGFPEWYWSHPYRDNAAYFALPWKFNDNSADRCAALQGGDWDGYWRNPERPSGKPEETEWNSQP